MKKGVVLFGLLSLLLLGGCSAFGGSGQKAHSDSGSAVSDRSAVDYQKLSKADKRKVKFDFRAVSSRSDYDITVKIKNEAARPVRFDFAEFKIYSAIDRDIKSDRHDSLVVKPHEVCEVRRLFTGINKSTLNDPTNYFVYIDQHYKLSKFTFRITSGKATKEANQLTASNDNHVTTNVDAPKAAFSGSSGSQSAGNSSGSVASSGADSSSADPSAPAKILTSASMAKALYLHSMGFTSARGEGVYAVPTSYGYKVTDDALQNTVSYFNNSGDELDANGNVIATFSTLAGPTAAAPEGFIYKDANYSQY